ncbi:hypothetical protein L209DRAFT_511563 [Thermothelomyces heterothallicus CBS 203.75]
MPGAERSERCTPPEITIKDHRMNRRALSRIRDQIALWQHRNANNGAAVKAKHLIVIPKWTSLSLARGWRCKASRLGILSPRFDVLSTMELRDVARRSSSQRRKAINQRGLEPMQCTSESCLSLFVSRPPVPSRQSCPICSSHTTKHISVSLPVPLLT